METRSKRLKLNLGEVTETRTERSKVKSKNVVERRSSRYLNRLPYEIFLKIFRFLSIRERWIVGRVCKRFYAISRDPDPFFWKKVSIFQITWDVPSPKLTFDRIIELFQIFPKNVTSLKIFLDFEDKNKIIFSEFSGVLMKACPNLQELSVKNAVFIDAQSSHITYNLSNLLPKNITVLQLHDIKTSTQTYLEFDDYYTSKIEVFDIKYDSYFYFNPFFLLKMPRLRELHLSWRDSLMFDSIQSVIRQLNVLDLSDSLECLDIFQRVMNYGINLSTLYVCDADLQDEDIRLLESTTVLPRLKVICLFGCPVTYKRINSLINSRLSLQAVYVSNREKDNYRRFDYSRCNYIKVKVYDHEDERDFDDFDHARLEF